MFELCKPASVVDFGCGVGSWLLVAEALGAEKLVGIEGEWMDETKLLCPKIKLINSNLEYEVALSGTFDLCISVEVAEHVDETYANTFIANLTKSSNTIIFGAAIPGQGGLNHVNEQPQSYWKEKIELHGYSCFDIFRPRLWGNTEVEAWYVQNTFLFTKCPQLLEKLYKLKYLPIFDIVHPKLFNEKASHLKLLRDNIGLIRDAALNVESIDIQQAHDLMSLAHRLRPNGPFINKKLLEYKRKLAGT